MECSSARQVLSHHKILKLLMNKLRLKIIEFNKGSHKASEHQDTILLKRGEGTPLPLTATRLQAQRRLKQLCWAEGTLCTTAFGSASQARVD